MTIPTLAGITSKTITTPRLTTRVLFSGADNGIPVLFLHGNASSATYWEEVMLALPPTYRGIAPDQRKISPMPGVKAARLWALLPNIRQAVDELAKAWSERPRWQDCRPLRVAPLGISVR
jgi:hypothetical protein